MAGVALNGAEIEQSIKSNHVSYDRYVYMKIQDGYCREYDPEDPTRCIDYVEPVYSWVYMGKYYTNAKINGTISASSSVYVNGTPVVTVGSITNESWVADPPVPAGGIDENITNIQPGTFGSGQGSVTGGNSSNVYVNGKLLAMEGSEVTTHLGNTTTIKSGSSNVFVGG